MCYRSRPPTPRDPFRPARGLALAPSSGQTRSVRWIVGGGLWALGGVAFAAEPSALQTNPDVQTIVGGEEVEPGAYPEVVGLLAQSTLCSGVAVAPRLILTAAHCTRNLDPNTTIIIRIGDTLDEGTGFRSDSFGSHPDFEPVGTGSDLFDYGYVVTNRELPGPYAIPITTQEEWDLAMQWEHAVTVVGFGADEEETSGIKRQVTVAINGFSELGEEFYAGGGGKDSCVGDSGGAVFVELPDGARRLIGLVSRGSGTCGSRGVYAVPHRGLCWVRDESGVDVAGSCETCDCIDLTPPPKPEEGCGQCGTRGERGSPTWLGIVLVLGIAGLRRRPRLHM